MIAAEENREDSELWDKCEHALMSNEQTTLLAQPPAEIGHYQGVLL
jgi:hypothetical protein